MRRWVLVLMTILALGTVAAGCEITVEPQVVEEPEMTAAMEATPEVGVTTEAVETETISFMTWAASGFEEQALGEMVESFQEAYGIQVDLEIVK